MHSKAVSEMKDHNSLNWLRQSIIKVSLTESWPLEILQNAGILTS